MKKIENNLSPGRINFVASLLKVLGREEGIQVRIEPVWGCVGKIIKRNGQITYFRGSYFDLNGLGSAEIATDKAYANYFLKQAGYKIIPTKVFFSPNFAKILKSHNGLNKAYQSAKKIGWPVIIKPNSRSRGELVCLAHNRREFMLAAKKICQIDRVFLVQPLIPGHDYRVLILDDQVISAYERLPLSVTGDGLSTIGELLDKKQKDFAARGRDTIINRADFRLNLSLKRQHLSRTTVLPRGQTMALLTNRNLSTGGQAIDVTDRIHNSYKKLAINIARDMGLRYCGVDLMVQKDIGEPLNPRTNNYYIIEINAAPGLDHYAESGGRQYRIVKELYRKILRKLIITK